MKTLFGLFAIFLILTCMLLFEYLHYFIFIGRQWTFNNTFYESCVNSESLCFEHHVNKSETKIVRNIHHNGKTGRLGNLMFSYASVKGIAHLTNRTSSFAPPFTSLYPAFSNLKINIQRNHAKSDGRNDTFPRLQQHGSFSFEPERLITGLPSDDVEICCWLQSWKYFSCIDKKIRHEFTFKKEHLQKASSHFRTVEQLVMRISGTSDNHSVNFVGVHVRVADIHKEKPKSLGFRVAPVHYITAAMDYFRDRYRDPQFMLCTDDNEWVRQHIGVMKRDIHLIDTGYYE